MKRLLFILLTAASMQYNSAQGRVFDIQIKVKGMENQIGILAYNYGAQKFIADTLHFNNNGITEIKGEKNYNDGIYLVAFPTLNLNSFEFIIRETKFQLSTDTNNLAINMVVKNSLENQIMYEDLKKAIQTSIVMDSLNSIISDTNTSKDIREKAEEQKKKTNQEYTDKRIETINKNPKALYNKVLSALRDVPLPESNKNQQLENNSGYNYLIHHYWDNIDFNDVALIKSPVIIPRIMTFLDQIYQHPDSISHAIDIILEKSEVNQETFKILSSEIVNKYAKSNIMGQESIYVHLLDKYYLAGKTPWVDQSTIDKMKERAEALRPTLIGKIAPDISVYDLNNRPVHFSQSIQNNDYTILVFWNSECSHCKKEIPEIMEIWKDSLQKQYNVGVFSVSTEIEREHAQQFVDNNHLNDVWTNVYDPTGESNFRKLYDINSTPVIIILDKERRIFAKKIAVQDIPYVISVYDDFHKKEIKSKNSSSK
ncbi:MAG: DUF5106 domain-containing protein [Chitinophagales bacterium]|nr:DUF5106 domain-containing protein [Chitinophagales bacterium]MCZ2393607.1 DUF5106 domain-containing protein [Chitinophagales bacterium]